MNYYDKSRQNDYFSKYPKLPRHMDLLNPMNKPTEIPKPQPQLNLFTPDEAFMYGTIFRNLYQPYKNHQPRFERPTNEKDRLRYEVDKYYFALHELRLYLDAYPTDQEAINVFTKFQQEYIKAKNAYESKFGALDIEAPNLNTSPWNWTMGRWPWESER